MAAWLDLVRDSAGWALVDTGRMDRIVQDMSHPATQYPSLVYFLGNGNRVAALRSLFPQNNVTRRGPAGLARLHLSTTTASTEYPIWFAESGFHESTANHVNDRLASADHHRHYPLATMPGSSVMDRKHHVWRRAVFPWTSVLCLFVDGSADLQAAHDLLDRPPTEIHAGSHSTSSPGMRVIMVLTDPSAEYHTDSWEELLSGCPNPDPPDATFSILDLRDRHDLSPCAAFEPLRRTLLDQIQISRAQRAQQGLLFSARHLNYLWHRTLSGDQLRTPQARIDCLQIAREQLPVDPALGQRLADFLARAGQAGCPPHDIHRAIASALLMDAYPPGMHRFRPDDIYDSLYREHCRTAWELQQDPHPDRHCDAVRQCLAQCVAQLGPRRSSVAIRREVLTAVGARWPEICLPTVCCFCLSRSIEHMLPCRHAICDTCVTIFGSPSRTAEYHVDLRRCPWCQETFELTVRQLPPTKGAVLVALDGGGIRGLVTLGLLRTLERRLEGALTIAQMADYIIGTSVGAFITTDLVYNGTSVEEGYHKFQKFARQAFRPSGPTSRLWSWLAPIVGILNDGYYDTNSLDHTLNELLPPSLRLFDVPAQVPMGIRVGVVASRTSDGKPILFPNYRSMASRSEKLPYEVVQGDCDAQNRRLQDVVGCSVAAPCFFRPRDLPAWGTFQDGGVRANNPTGIAQEECRVIWPSRRTHDLLVSVGTGCASGTQGMGDRPDRHFPAGWGPVRLWRAYNSSPCMDGMEAYREGRVHVPSSLRSNTIRLDHALDGDLPRLDDVDRLEALAALPFTVPDELVRAVLATCFFFELVAPPSRAGGQYHLRGSVLCARTQARRIVDRVLVEFPGARFQNSRGHPLGRVDNDDGCPLCGYYRKQVALSVPSLDEEVTISLASATQQRPIGGFPKTIRQLLHDQQTEAVFGRPDHEEDCWPPRRSCYCVRTTKRRVHFAEPARERKKRRL